jgi:rod shape-determining protein MreD
VSALYLVLLVLLCLLAQAALAPRISAGQVSPDFIILVVAVVGLYRGAIAGAVVGFIVGFLQDVGNPEMLGLNALIKTLLGFAVGRVASKASVDNAMFLLLLVAAAALAHDILYLTMFHWPRVGGSTLMVFRVALPSAIYTAVFAVLIDILATRSGAKAVAFGKKRQR